MKKLDMLMNGGLIIAVICLLLSSTITNRQISELQHEVLQLQAQTKWLEEAITPKHLQGSND